MSILMWQSHYYNLVVLKVKANLKPPSLTVIIRFTNWVAVFNKQQGRDEGSSVAFDYDNKVIQRMTAISTQYTVRINER